jgi:hypothetical protein
MESVATAFAERTERYEAAKRLTKAEAGLPKEESPE